jgi:hypothetical protein
VVPTLPRAETEEGDVADRGSGSNGMAGRVLAVIIAVGAIAVAATTGDSWAVRTTLVLVAGDVAVRLWRWGS